MLSASECCVGLTKNDYPYLDLKSSLYLLEQNALKYRESGNLADFILVIRYHINVYEHYVPGILSLRAWNSVL
jgi:hypothetical protein